MNANLQVLKDNLAALSDYDNAFAASLLAQFAKKGSLSDKQWPWIDTLAERALTKALGLDVKPAANAVDLGDFTGVIALFDKAKKHLKYPRVVLALTSGTEIALSVAGPTAKHPGTINVTTNAAYGDRTWFGRVTVAGKWDPSNKADAYKNDLTSILTKLAANPARVAADYGKMTGRCCFCYTNLDHPTSVALGYGPTCAKNYGLPWNKGTAEAKAA
jgi:hypothetical protein